MVSTGYQTPGSNENSRSSTPVDNVERGERGYRRKKLAALAGSLYRSGQAAVTEIRETYAQSRSRDLDGDFDPEGSLHIPGAFPDVAIASQGAEQMMIFPCYAKRHIKKDWDKIRAEQPQATTNTIQTEEYWKQEWEKKQDEKAVVDVDIRGWLYAPHQGPMTRRSRLLVGLARQLSGIPRTDQTQAILNPLPDDTREQEKIAQEAANIERKGQQEKHIANKGAYSEPHQETSNLSEPVYPLKPPRIIGESLTPDSAPGSPKSYMKPTPTVNELTEPELAVANATLLARIAPFLTTPLISMPVTLFFYNETKSQSRTVLTNDVGHFVIRAPLDFVPTHVRVLANDNISSTQEVKIIEPYGVSLISDIDDTIKMSNISSGAREIFRNTFVRDLSELTIEGVREWYGDLHDLGVSLHYCSNSPWPLYPMLATYFKLAGLPQGSLHLKQYTGMLGGIFEPVAERKKNTLLRLLKDFPQRKFLCVGDSGEADLEVYTELAISHPGRVLAIFIRDVTTPPDATPYFEPTFDLVRRAAAASSLSLNDGRLNADAKARKNSSPGPISDGRRASGPVMGTLIDFSDEPENIGLDDAKALNQIRRVKSGQPVSATELLGRKAPPPRPAKPAALSSIPSASAGSAVGLGLSGVPTRYDPQSDADNPPLPPRKPVAFGSGNVPPVRKLSGTEDTKVTGQPPPPPPPRRRGTPSNLRSLSPKMFGQGRGPSSNSDVDFEPLPPSVAQVPVSGATYYKPPSGNTSPSGSPPLGATGANKKLDLWRRRVVRSREQLDQIGVLLYTWRRGQDVQAEAMGLVKRELEAIELAQ